MAVQLFHIGVKALCKNSEGKYLLLQVNTERLRGDNPAYWDIPGGRIEEGDTVAQTLVREIHEELGLTVEEGGEFLTAVVSNIKIPTDNGEVGLVLMIYTIQIDESAEFVISDEHIGYEWVDGATAAERLQFKYPKEFTEKLL